MKTDFPDPDDILNFALSIEPDEGMYRGGRFTFDFKINQNFPHEPPKVECRQKIYHPNIDLQGKVCLNILREDWKPVLNLNAVIVGLQVRSRPQDAVLHWSTGRRGKRLTTSRAVSLPGTQRVGPPQQGGSRRPAKQPRGFQAQRAIVHGRRFRQRHHVRSSAEVRGAAETTARGQRHIDTRITWPLDTRLCRRQARGLQDLRPSL